jgi:hypothetical protein
MSWISVPSFLVQKAGRHLKRLQIVMRRASDSWQRLINGQSQHLAREVLGYEINSVIEL